jgi:predicted metal-dependent peptidase
MYTQEQLAKAELVVKQATLRLMKHPQTCLYSGVMLMGDTVIVPKPLPFTANTDGFNSNYGVGFLLGLTLEEITGLRLHETLHIVLKHIPRHRDLWREDAQLANVSMDHAVNNIIMDLPGYGEWIKLPKGGVCDRRFKGWSVRQIYDYLKTGKSHDPNTPLPQGNPQRGPGKPQQGQGQGQTSASSQHETVTIGGEKFDLETLDEHIPFEGTKEDLQKLSKDINEALQQGSMLAGRMGSKVPREITESMELDVDWRAETAEFLTDLSRGREEASFRRFNRRRLVDDIIAPSCFDETMDELIYAPDTSGSITGEMLAEAGEQLASLCELLRPKRVRVLWWDTRVHGEQVFEDNYDNLRHLLKPVGGGGTRIGCISDYINKHQLDANCMVVITDGYLESSVQWNTSIPSLWLVTGNKQLSVPHGVRLVKYN